MIVNCGSDVFLKEDLQGILNALLATNEAAMMTAPGAENYRRGFAAAILAMAMALDIQIDRRLLNAGNH